MTPEELVDQHRELTEWVRQLEAFLKETTQHFQPQSTWGRAKKRLLAKRPLFLETGKKGTT